MQMVIIICNNVRQKYVRLYIAGALVRHNNGGNTADGANNIEFLC